MITIRLPIYSGGTLSKTRHVDRAWSVIANTGAGDLCHRPAMSVAAKIVQQPGACIRQADLQVKIVPGRLMPGIVRAFSSSAKTLALIVCALCSSLSLFAGPPGAHSAVVGMVSVSQDATVNGRPALQSETLFSGDKLKVGDGAVEVMLRQGSRLSLGKDTDATLESNSGETRAILGHGNATIRQGQHGDRLWVSVGDVSILPSAGVVTDAEVRVSNEFLEVLTRKGSVRLQGNGQDLNVPGDKAVRLRRIQDQGQQGSGNAPSAPTPEPQSPQTENGKFPAPPAAGGKISFDLKCWEYCILPAAGETAGFIAIALALGNPATATSPESDWYYALVPAGGAAGALICWADDKACKTGTKRVHTSTALVSNPNPSTPGQPVTLTATITSTTGMIPFGTVQFFDGAKLVTSASLDSSGVATLSYSQLTQGTHTITAKYLGEKGYSASTSDVLVHVVTP